MGWGWQPYVSVAQRRTKAKRAMDQLRKMGVAIQPVEIDGRTITRTFWGKAWCGHLESYSTFENRLPRGRTYVRNGSVCHLDIAAGRILAKVSGSDLYDVEVKVHKLPDAKWTAVKQKCAGQIGSLIELLQGRLSQSVMSIVTNKTDGLFPAPKEITFNCSCPDWATMCKHVAAVLYGVGARFDDQPELLFLLRGVEHIELLETNVAAATTLDAPSKRRRVASSDLEDVFGISLFDDDTTGEATSNSDAGVTDSGGKVEISNNNRLEASNKTRRSDHKAPASKSAKIKTNKAVSQAIASNKGQPRANSQTTLCEPSSAAHLLKSGSP